jgi:hypothetical protein
VHLVRECAESHASVPVHVLSLGEHVAIAFDDRHSPGQYQGYSSLHHGQLLSFSTASRASQKWHVLEVLALFPV